MHYTLTNIPDDLDRALRERAATEHKSLEVIIVDILAGCLNIKSPQSPGKVVCSESTSNWRNAPEFEASLRDQNLIDWEAWSDGVKRRDLAGIAGERLITPEMKIVFAEQRRIDPELWR
jgi:hypothetical protein